MRCSNCGKEIDDKSLFCSYCGAKIEPTNSVNTSKETIPSKNKAMPVWLHIILAILGILLMMWGWNGLKNSL